MVQFRGKCACCGVTWAHKNFKGCREGRLIPDLCFVTLRKKRHGSDNRLCNSCYKCHLANTPAEPLTPTTPIIPRRRSSTSSLDGIHWSDTSSDRVKKMVRIDTDGVPVIPVALHEQRMVDMKDALRSEQLMFLERRKVLVDEQMECDGVEAIFLRNDLSDNDRANVFCRVLEYYKENPSAKRARLLQDLSNVQAGQIAGVSSKTMAKARKLEFGDQPVPPRKVRVGVSRGGYTTEEVADIAFQACFNPRFCEVRSWVSHAGKQSQWHWEAIGLVDIKTMWEALCRKHQDFCCLRNFYKLMPDFYVEKKKERCVCAHCKRGRRYLDDAAMLVNVLRHSLADKDPLEGDLEQLRFDLLCLFGHLDKEIVIDIADGRHTCDTKQCNKCGLLATIPHRASDIASLVVANERNLKISLSEWGSVFPGIAVGANSIVRHAAVIGFFARWESETSKYVEHLFLKGDRIRELECDVESLKHAVSTEVWFSDYMMSVKLIGAYEETESDFLSKETANNLGFMRLYWADGQLWREYWDFVFEGAKDIQATVQIQKQFLLFVKEERAERKLTPLTCVKIWADNATDFKGGDAWDQWQKHLKDVDEENPLERVVFNYHAEGEGKTKLDAHFGHLNILRRKRERMKLERRTVKDLLDSMLDAEATHVVHVRLDRENEGRFYSTTTNVKRFHQIEITAGMLKGKETSHSRKETIVLGDVKERKTKRSLEQKARQPARSHAAAPEECQKCHNQLQKDESVDEWIQCESCDRSWHKTCVGYAANMALRAVAWKQCSDCGGADPEGEMLQKRRKTPMCVVCGQRRKGFDHSDCQQQKATAAASFRTPKAQLLGFAEHPIRRKKETSARKKRKTRKVKKRRKNRGTIVSQARRHQLAQYLK